MCREVISQYYWEERMSLAMAEGGGSVVEGRLVEVRFNACSGNGTNKSTALIYRKCLCRIKAQLANIGVGPSSLSSPSPSSTLFPQPRKFDLLTTVCLAHSF